MLPTYKKVKTYKPHCPECGEMLGGDNSFINPYVCKCGVWRWTFMNERNDFEIVNSK